MTTENIDDGVRTDWAGLLKRQDVEGVWNALLKLVTRHPATRPLRFATDDTSVSSSLEINAELTQELFLELLQKGRFEHYVANGYTTAQIGNELTHIELPNFVGSKLRTRYPESFRMARRVSSLLKTSPAFRRLGGDGSAGFSDASARPAAETPEGEHPRTRGGRGRKSGSTRPTARENCNRIKGSEAGAESISAPADDRGKEEAVDALGEAWNNGHDEQVTAEGDAHRARVAPGGRRMVDQIYGLTEWRNAKAMRDVGRFVELARAVPVRPRDTRIVGRHGSSQLIISTEALEGLIIEIFRAIDSPADVRTMRQLTLSKIPLQDCSIASLDDEFGRMGGGTYSAVSTCSNGQARRKTMRAGLAVDSRPSPEEALLAREHAEFLQSLASEFLATLSRTVNDKASRYQRLLDTLWHCYFDPAEPSQLLTAQLMGVSDSLVSSNRKLIEGELKRLSLTPEDGPVFSEELRQLVASRKTSAHRVGSSHVIPFPIGAGPAAAAAAGSCMA